MKEEITMKKINKSSKKGFTLVELIVVLVILAILAAMLVPALTGYIDRARKEKDFQTAASVLTAVQALATEDYGTAADLSSITYSMDIDDVEDLVGIPNIQAITAKVADGIVTELTVQFEDGGAFYAYKYGCTAWGSDETSATDALADVQVGSSVTQPSGTPVAVTFS